MTQRFGVWQNVHVLDMASVGNLSSVARLHVHIQSWYDEVEGFDTSEIGYLNFTARRNLSYVAFASATISQVGCGRAIYTRRDEQTNRKDLHTIPDGFGDRVETLVCNYGPLDRKTPRELYQDGVPDLCPQGTVESPRYGALCRVSSEKLQEWPSRKAHRGSQPAEEEKTVQTMTSGAFPIKRAVYLVQLALLLLARLST
ncbi:uncharacterized protein LOC128890375 [Hylaeus anthracinus]|uniref:uncharacterized protein LOC128890375 n=1 Tax=Hylaeus anthracinus TaxID=313031 RepID=UPI0023B95F36|nr:uncharacterized protein LOC128890375 [Hylaeus anthracinus]